MPRGGFLKKGIISDFKRFYKDASQPTGRGGGGLLFLLAIMVIRRALAGPVTWAINIPEKRPRAGFPPATFSAI